METKKKFLLFSGEGRRGTWELTKPLTLVELQNLLNSINDGGEKWAWPFVVGRFLTAGATPELDEFSICFPDGEEKASMSRQNLIGLGVDPSELL